MAKRFFAQVARRSSTTTVSLALTPCSGIRIASLTLYIRRAGVEVVNLNLDSCKKLMAEFIERYPEVWNEDIGEEDK